MNIQEMTEELGLSSSTIRDWSNSKHTKHKLYKLLEATTQEEARNKIQHPKKLNRSSIFSEKAKSVKLDKSWFHGDKIWSSADGTRIGIDNLITLYMAHAYQQNTDKLVELFGKNRVSKCVNTNLSDEKNLLIAQEQISYALHKTTINIKSINRVRTFKKNLIVNILKDGSQKQIDNIYNRLGLDRIIDIAKLADRKIVNKQIVQKVKYSELRLA